MLTTAFYNVVNIALMRPVRIGYDSDSALYFVRDGQEKLYIAHSMRNLRYKRGIKGSRDRLAGIYHLDQVTYQAGDVFIDCGAHVGELGMWVRDNDVEYHGFEPDDDAANACDQNLFGGEKNINRCCLWHQDTTVKLHKKTNTADSSVLEIKSFTEACEVPAIRLDSYCKDKGITRVRLFKLEAEGAEPEVLQGATEMLGFTDYVTVDCGYERGLKQEHTVVEVANMLCDRGFRLAAARMTKRATFLFASERVLKEK
jgi:FkbM family methyltransferase